MTDVSKFPLYQSHKRVRAIKFIAVENLSHVSWLVLEDGSKIERPAEWMRKHMPVAPGYLVVYQDGYESYSPVEAFEKGYWKIGHREGRRQAVVEQAALELQERITGKGVAPTQWHETVQAFLDAYRPRRGSDTLTHTGSKR